ncbi:2-polyprenylphenol 6-hydroxylase [Candidatus Tisiphia endosymbiont of Nemotelus uliginosus]|uniref:2-polyprenylphenol 6-hydroxylase n=1 Tax=Candidatus Tisiphia endosymbiont of Nemotelus uliginosus TaxID=3077926 RepID=UPI0035C931AD
MLFNLWRLLCLLYVVSKQQILVYPGTIKLPRRLKAIGWLIALIIYPISAFRRPQLDFGIRLANCLQELGPIYIKLGQTLSTRPDLVGNRVAEYLKLLQDKLPPFDSKIVRQLLHAAFEEEINELFTHFDDNPVAAASIAQVHKATLKSGELVAVKILRPGIHRIYNRDITFLYYIAKLLIKLSRRSQRLQPVGVIDVFKVAMKFELDLRLEAAAASELADNFQNDQDLYIPKIYWQLTQENILTTEWIDGISIYDQVKLRECNIDPKQVAQKFATVFFNQVYRDGFFHADLHPGNVLVKPNGSIVLLDFGIMGRLANKDRLAIAESLFGFFTKNYRLVALVHLRAGYIPTHTNLDHFAQKCRAVATPILEQGINNIAIGSLLGQLFKITEDFGMEVQPQLLLLQKTIVVVEGVGQQLDPTINIWQLIEPWIKKWAAKNISFEAKMLRILKHSIKEMLEKINRE